MGAHSAAETRRRPGTPRGPRLGATVSLSPSLPAESGPIYFDEDVLRDAWKTFFKCRTASCALTLGDDSACATKESSLLHAMAAYSECHSLEERLRNELDAMSAAE